MVLVLVLVLVLLLVDMSTVLCVLSGDARRYTLQPVFTRRRHRCHVKLVNKPTSVIYELFIYVQVLPQSYLSSSSHLFHMSSPTTRELTSNTKDPDTRSTNRLQKSVP